MDKNIVTFGEIMLRLGTNNNLRFSQADNFTATYGGGESNVAVSLAHFGMNVSFISKSVGNTTPTPFSHLIPLSFGIKSR